MNVCIYSLMAGTCFLCLSSCQDSSSGRSKEGQLDSISMKSLENDISALKTQIEWLEEDCEKQREDYLELSEKILELEFKEMSKNQAFFNVSKGISDGFQVIEDSFGCFLISLKEVTPYLSGYKLVFAIGNPLFTTYENVNFKINWNRSYESWQNDKEYAAKLEQYMKDLDGFYKKSLTDNNKNIKRPERPIRLGWSEEKKV